MSRDDDFQLVFEIDWAIKQAPDAIAGIVEGIDMRLVRWGDPVWGGSLTLLDLAVDRQCWPLARSAIDAGLTPSPRTWKMALLHDSPEAAEILVHYFDTPQDHPYHSHIARAKAVKERTLLGQACDTVSDGDSVRRL